MQPQQNQFIGNGATNFFDKLASVYSGDLQTDSIIDDRIESIKSGALLTDTEKINFHPLAVNGSGIFVLTQWRKDQEI